MVFDAHARAFEFYRGTCTRGIYDNMKTVVESVFVGKDRQFNRRFLQMCGHYLVEPTACTPASGWEKGQVENQVGTLREGYSRRGCGSRAMTSSTLGCSTGASLMPRPTGIQS
jgi:transposase